MGYEMPNFEKPKEQLRGEAKERVKQDFIPVDSKAEFDQQVAQREQQDQAKLQEIRESLGLEKPEESKQVEVETSELIPRTELLPSKEQLIRQVSEEIGPAPAILLEDRARNKARSLLENQFASEHGEKFRENQDEYHKRLDSYINEGLEQMGL